MIHIKPERIKRLEMLARSFPTLSRTPAECFGETFDAERFAEFHQSGGGGQCDAALFILSVWNHLSEWSIERHGARRFDFHGALGNWDPSHREAFGRWVADPFWL